jgi:hypothetical protein
MTLDQPGIAAGTGSGAAGISFTVPVKEAKGESNVKVVGIAQAAPAECENPDHTGAASAKNPEADSGFLCIYAAAPPPILGAGFAPLGAFQVDSTSFGFSPSGAVVVGLGAPDAFGTGSWAVTGF